MGAAILVILTVVTGLVVYNIMKRQTESILATSLELSLQSRSRTFETAINNGVAKTLTVATRPFLIEQIKQRNADPNDAAATLALQRAVESFLPTGFSALAILGVDRAEYAHAGIFTENPDMNVVLNFPYQVSLLWKDGFTLRVQMNVLEKNTKIGAIRAEVKLPALGRMLFEVSSLGKTGELAVCAPLQADIQCFPMALHPKPMGRLASEVNGQPLPMSHALAGDTGVLRANDYRRQEVVAAYMPIGNTSLGMVLKVDGSELFSPVKHQLLYVLPMLGLLVLAGVLMLRWLVAPLVRRMAISEQETRDANARLVESETRVRTIFDSVDDGIIVINSAGVIESFNPGAERIFGYRADEVIGRNVSILMPEAERRAHDRHIQRYLETGNATIIGIGREVTGQRKDGTSFPLDLRVREMQMGASKLFVGAMRDVTERKSSEQRILHLATHDALTDLPNRNLLQDRIQQAIAHAGRRALKVAILFVDLDKFKQVNDLLGHNVGDQLLIEVADRLRRELRSEDTIARQGGDEFIIVLPDVQRTEDAGVVAEKLLHGLAVPYLIQGREVQISASIGISVYPDNGDDVETLMKNSDDAMYRAKAEGRRGFRFFARDETASG
jgi:diguanylate cyclase (GGDEF)-like protein/PAS domain S-box-containing protein